MIIITLTLLILTVIPHLIRGKSLREVANMFKRHFVRLQATYGEAKRKRAERLKRRKKRKAKKREML